MNMTRVLDTETADKIKQYPNVTDAIVVRHEQDGASDMVIAYVVLDDVMMVSVVQLKTELEADDTVSTVPDFIFIVVEIPRTEEGDIEFDLLPVVQERPELEVPYVAPSNDMQRQITALIEQIIGIRPVGVDDTFAELGLNSLQAIQIIVEVEKAFGQELPLYIFEEITVREVENFILQQRKRLEELEVTTTEG